MKLRCPRCEQKLVVPDKYAGKTIRCSACNRAFKVPEPKVAVGATTGQAPVDMAGLAALESRSAEMGAEDLAAAQAALDAEARALAAKEKFRTCPHCNKRVDMGDPRVEQLCSHCWEPIPPVLKMGVTTSTDSMRTHVFTGAIGKGGLGFYTGLAQAVTYPFQASGSLFLAVAIAIGVTLVPVFLLTAIATATKQSDVGTAQGVQAADLTFVQVLLRVFFLIEVVYFSAVAIHAFLDVVRATAIGEEQPPPLVLMPSSSWSKSIVALFSLILYYIVMTWIVITVAAEGSFDQLTDPETAEQIVKQQGVLVGLFIVTLIVPMNLIGLSLGSIAEGLNPLRALKSIGKTHVHYLFLVLLLSVWGSLFVYAFFEIIKWFIPETDRMIAASGTGQLGTVALGMVFWGLVMGFAFYGTYVLGRIHGLFARTYRKKLFFGKV